MTSFLTYRIPTLNPIADELCNNAYLNQHFRRNLLIHMSKPSVRRATFANSTGGVAMRSWR